jgi:spermidine/putrescine transport system ATP-binding protein
MTKSDVSSVSVHAISKRFAATEVLRQVSLTLPRGIFATLLGPSGCGKTTLLRIIAGLEIADSGTIQVSGQDVTTVPAHRRPVNTVFQQYALFPHLSVWENVAFGLRSRRMPEADIKTRCHRVMEMLHIGGLAERRPDQLSGGQRQRVAVARALVNEPEVLLLDEPLSALDAKLRYDVQVELRRLQRQLGTTFLLVTHDQDEALSVSDTVMVMNHGRIVQQGSPREIYDYPTSRFVADFLGAANLIPVNSINGNQANTACGILQINKTPTWNNGTLAIRPERILVHPQAPTHNGFSGIIRDAIFRGDHVDLHVECAHLTLRVRAPASSAGAVGTTIGLELPTTDLRVLDD